MKLNTIITICLLLFGAMAIQAQEALRIYTTEISRIENLKDETQKSDGRGKALAAFFDSRIAEANKQTAINETVPYLRQLADYDFRGAYIFLEKLKNLDDAKMFMQNHLSKEERTLVRTMATHIASNANTTNAPAYPASIPQPGYGVKGKWTTGNSNNNAIVQNNTTTPNNDNGSVELAKGTEAHDAKNYTDAMKWYKLSADKGNMTAVIMLRALEKEMEMSKIVYGDNGKAEFEYGSTLEQAGKTEEALIWYKKAADKGNVDAAFNLGLINYKRRNEDKSSVFEKDNKYIAEAVQWFQKAADLGDAEALFNLGSIHYIHYKDNAKAKDYLQKAVKSGNKKAEELLKNLGW
jgi:hypothetical protein